ncbi:acyltransferase family protein [Pseudoduganella sp. RAF53_2]|uniref:acyltransferase family protein n=1 Tax=unclassified Pseudoduganella TaxID=2637179 RepID=UPI003F9C753D
MNEKAHDNAFDVLRMTAAAAVLYSHSFPLLGLPEPEPLPGLTWGRLAVAVFFGISGFLVAQSWESDSHGLRFLARRALRIFPGLLVLALLSALVLGPAVTVLPLAGIFPLPPPGVISEKPAWDWAAHRCPGCLQTILSRVP